MKSLFNSLGSNYSKKYIELCKQMLFTNKNDDAYERLVLSLHLMFNGTYCTPLYKGRDAIAAALKLIEPTANKKVFIQAFACYAVEEAVLRSGYEACYVDVDERSLNPSIKTLDNAAKVHGYPKALILQHTLGYAVDIGQISTWCKKHNVFFD